VNALVGGTVLADSLGLDSSMNGRWTRRLTTVALIASMVIAIVLATTGRGAVGVILVAQALTVLGLPAIAVAMIHLGSRGEAREKGLIPPWLLCVAVGCAAVSILLAARKAWELWLRLGVS
jgi:Mn2+/Fe2+ NRAMP family transporter